MWHPRSLHGRPRSTRRTKQKRGNCANAIRARAPKPRWHLRFYRSSRRVLTTVPRVKPPASATLRSRTATLTRNKSNYRRILPNENARFAFLSGFPRRTRPRVSRTQRRRSCTAHTASGSDDCEVILPRLKARASRAASAEADLHGASKPDAEPPAFMSPTFAGRARAACCGSMLARPALRPPEGFA